MLILKTFGLFVVTAIAEIVGCYLPYLWLKKNGSPWLLIPAMASLALFAWLLSLHPTAAVLSAHGFRPTSPKWYGGRETCRTSSSKPAFFIHRRQSSGRGRIERSGPRGVAAS